MSSNSSEPTVYNCLSARRAERGLSRRDLADAVHINYQTLGYLERGDFAPDLALALRISAYFELPLETIFSLQPFHASREDRYGRLM